jgi:toxin CcdB
MQCAIHRLVDSDDLVCRVQSELGAETSYILCAPVVTRQSWRVVTPKLHLPCAVGDEPHLILMSQMLALPAYQLGAVVGDASAQRDDVVAAVDLLVSGF